MIDFARSTHPGVQAQLDRLGYHLAAPAIISAWSASPPCSSDSARPQDRPLHVFHVAGTNGKVSTRRLPPRRDLRHRAGPFTPLPALTSSASTSASASPASWSMMKCSPRFSAKCSTMATGIEPSFFEMGDRCGAWSLSHARQSSVGDPRGLARRPPRRDQRRPPPARHRHRQHRRSTISNIWVRTLAEIAAEKAAHRQARRPAGLANCWPQSCL